MTKYQKENSSQRLQAAGLQLTANDAVQCGIKQGSKPGTRLDVSIQFVTDYHSSQCTRLRSREHRVSKFIFVIAGSLQLLRLIICFSSWNRLQMTVSVTVLEKRRAVKVVAIGKSDSM